MDGLVGFYIVKFFKLFLSSTLSLSDWYFSVCVWFVCFCLICLFWFDLSVCAWYVCFCLICLLVFDISVCVWFVYFCLIHLFRLDLSVLFDLSVFVWVGCLCLICLHVLYLSVCFLCVYVSAFGFICLFVFDLSVWVICVCLCLICLFVCKGRMCAACVEYNNRIIRISCLIYKLIQFVFMPTFISRELTNLFFFLTYSSFSTASVCLLTHLSLCLHSSFCRHSSFCLSIMSYCLFVCLPTRLSPCLLCLVVHLHTYLSFCQYIY